MKNTLISSAKECQKTTKAFSSVKAKRLSTDESFDNEKPLNFLFGYINYFLNT